MIRKTAIILLCLSGLTGASINASEPKSKPVNDVEGNKYQTIVVGDQVWMAENLKTSLYSDGTPIPHVEEKQAWSETNGPAFSWYNNNKAQHKNPHGALYNWYAVETGKLCPAGWHVATDGDWKILERTLGMTEEEVHSEGWRGSKGPAITGHREAWVQGYLKDEPGFNSSGFNAPPSGNRIGESGSFGNLGTNGYWWVNTESSPENAWYRSLFYGSLVIIKGQYPKNYGAAVRCVKD